MTNVKSGILSRFHAPITKFALSLCAIGIASAAQADWRDITWGGGSTAETKYWNDASNWIIGGVAQSSYSDLTAITSDGDWLFNQTADVHFNAATEVPNLDIRIVAPVTFSGDNAESGLKFTNNAWVFVGAWAPGSLTVASGSHSFGGDLRVGECQFVADSNPNGSLVVSSGSVSVAGTLAIGGGVHNVETNTANGTVEISGGSVSAANVLLGATSASTGTLTLNSGTITTAAISNGGGTGSIVFNGGTAVATTAAGGDFIPAAANYTVEIGNNGGTINNENNISISAAITGAGWLTKTGAGTLSLSNVDGFTGRIAVAENAGSVTLPASATNIKVGANTTKEVTENVIVFTYSATDYSNADNYWTGAGEGNDWATAGNWNTGLVGANNFVFHSGTLQGNAVSVEFADAYTGGASLFIENTTGGVVTFAKADGAGDTAGLSLSGALNVGTSTGDAGALTITSGDFTVGGATTIGNGNAGKLTISGGRLYSSGDYQLGFNASGNGTFELSGGEADSTFWFCTGRWGNSGGGGSATVTITDGTLKIGQGENSNGMIDLSCTEGSSTTFTQSGGYVYAPGNKNSGDSTVGCALSICGANNATASVTLSGAANMELGGYVSVGTWGTGTLTVSGGTLTTTAIKAGGGIGTVTLSGGTVVAAADGTFIPASEKLTVTVSGNATLDTDGKTITIDAAMLGDGTLTCVGGGTVTFTSLDSTCTIVQAEDGTIVNKPTVYYWIGGGTGNWNDKDNWSLSAGGAAAEDYPGEGSVVCLANGSVVTITESVKVYKVVVDGTATLKSGSNYLTAQYIVGDADDLLVLSGARIKGYEASNEISVPLKIDTDTENMLYTDHLGNNTGCGITVSSSISGNGTLVIYAYGARASGSNVNAGITLTGDNAKFLGIIEYRSGEYQNSGTKFQARQHDNLAAAASSENAEWRFYMNNTGTPDRKSDYVLFSTANGFYKFGAAQINLPVAAYTTAAGITFEIGNLDKDSEIKGTWGNAPTVNWVASTNTLTMSAKNSGNINVTKGGTLLLGNSDIMKSGSKITYSGANGTLKIASGVDFDPSTYLEASDSVAITFDDEGVSREWSGDLGGIYAFAKAGYGTLTLSAVPAYSGPTKVLEGKLVVPFGTALSTLELGDDAYVEVDMTGAAESAMAFSVGTLVGDKSKISLVNNTSGVEFALVETASGLVYVNGSRSFTWNGPTAVVYGDETTYDYNWSTPANWGSETDVPTSVDTVTIPAGKEVYVDVAASVLAITASGDVTIKGPANAKTSLTATSFVGGGSLTVSENVALSIGVMDVDGKITMTQSNIDSNSYADNLGDANVGTMDIANGFSGSGSLVNNGSLTLSGNDSFIGTIGGGQSVVKKGDDTYMLIGNNTFTGGLAIEEGTLKLGIPADIADITYDFDASVTNNLTYSDDEKVYPLTWKSSVGDFILKTVSTDKEAPRITTDYFGGNRSVFFGANDGISQMTLNVKGNVPETIFLVFTETQMQQYAPFWGESGNANFGISRRNGSNFNYFVRKEYVDSTIKTRYTEWGFFKNGSSGEEGRTYINAVNTGTVLATVDLQQYIRAGQTQAVGYNGGAKFVGAYGEVVGYSRNLNHAERKAIESYLMAKWNVGSATYNVIPTSADVTMKSGATLDMGGLTQTVKSFTGAGTVTNGYLKTTGDLTVDGGTLTIQATTGQTYVLSDVETERLVLTGNAKGYTVKAPENAKIVGRFVVPEGISVGFEGADVTVDAPRGWSITSKSVAGGILYRVGSFPFVLKLR